MSGPPTPPPTYGGQGNSWWDQMAERRLEEVTRRLSEVTQTVADVAKELRTTIRASDQQGSSLTRLEERLREAEVELKDLPRRFERMATVDGISKIESRLNSLEDESKSPFVRKVEFEPVRKAVFTVVGAVCLAVLGAVAKLVMK